MADLYPEAKREKTTKPKQLPLTQGREKKAKHANIKYQISAKITDDADPGKGERNSTNGYFMMSISA